MGRRTKNWIRRILLGLGVVLLGLGALYGWALLSTASSTFARALVWREADVGDLERFPARTIPAPATASRLPTGAEPDLVVPSQNGAPLDEVLGSDTSAFVVVHRGRLAYQRYLGGAEADTLQTSFSVAKSFLGALVGIAIGDGSIASVDDPVTDYVPELAERDTRFARISLRDLLTMSSGLRYEESGLPWAGDDS